MVETDRRSFWRWLLEPLVILIVHLTAKVDGLGWFSERHGGGRGMGWRVDMGWGIGLLVRRPLGAWQWSRMDRDRSRECTERGLGVWKTSQLRVVIMNINAHAWRYELKRRKKGDRRRRKPGRLRLGGSDRKQARESGLYNARVRLTSEKS